MNCFHYKLAFGIVSFLTAFLLFSFITVYQMALEQNGMISGYTDLICFYQQERLGLQNCMIPSYERIQEILNGISD